VSPARIALVGLPGSGKSSVGAALAAQLDWPLRDTDALIAARQGRSPAEIIDGDGEAAFRALEAELVEQLLSDAGPAVIACGGGLFAEPGPQRALLDGAWVVCLDAADEVLAGRLGEAADRPLLRGDVTGRLAELRRRRRGAHDRAHVRLATDGEAVEGVAAALVPLADSVRVDTRDGAYPIVVEPGAADHAAQHLPPGANRVAVVCDRAVAVLGRRIQAELRSRGLEVTTIPVGGGEAVKSWAHAGRLVERLGRLSLGRGDAVIAVGGGSVGDVAGFAAATYLRGVAWLTVPTTLLAMVDSAIGGKTAVNLGSGKNLAGAFWQPRAVLCDPTLLDTLADRELLSGLGEVAKYAMIDAGGEVATILESSLPRIAARDVAVLTALIERCAAIKARVVSADVHEQGGRAVLNYGHTVGHAIEAEAGYGQVTHGEAVAAGMRVAGRLSVRHAGLPVADLRWQDRILDAIGLAAPPPLPVEGVLQRLGHDKKAVAGRPRWVLLERRGHPRVGEALPDDAVRSAITEVLGG
jgi:shikimate kinase/3-dehydroquinate synthase